MPCASRRLCLAPPPGRWIHNRVRCVLCTYSGQNAGSVLESGPGPVPSTALLPTYTPGKREGINRRLPLSAFPAPSSPSLHLLPRSSTDSSLSSSPSSTTATETAPRRTTEGGTASGQGIKKWVAREVRRLRTAPIPSPPSPPFFPWAQPLAEKVAVLARRALPSAVDARPPLLHAFQPMVRAARGTESRWQSRPSC